MNPVFRCPVFGWLLYNHWIFEETTHTHQLEGKNVKIQFGGDLKFWRLRISNGLNFQSDQKSGNLTVLFNIWNLDYLVWNMNGPALNVLAIAKAPPFKNQTI